MAKIVRAVLESWTRAAYPEKWAPRWDAERTRNLLNLWEQGFSASQIATALGRVSRNAVVGRAHRLKLEARSDRPKQPRTPILLPPEAERIARALFESPFHRAAAASVLMARHVASIESAADASLAAKYTGESLKFSLESLFTYPKTEAHWRKFILIDTLNRDIDLLRNGTSPKELIRRPLFNDRSEMIVRIDFPSSNKKFWDFWRNWYFARADGNYLSSIEISQIEKVDIDLSNIPPLRWQGDLGDLYKIIQGILDGNSPADDDQGESADADPDEIGAQNPVALQFVADSEGRIDADLAAGADNLATDDTAADRHAEVVDSANDLLFLYSVNSIGANQAAQLVKNVDRLVEAIGEKPEAARPGLVVPRGERLRQQLKNQEQSDEVGADPPLPPPFVSALAVLVGAYNIYVAFDPELSRHDEAQLSPEDRNQLIGTELGDPLVESAVKSDVATPAAHDVLAEEGSVAPLAPDPDNRSSRRYSESLRNFGRAIVAVALKSVRGAWRHKGKIAGGAGSLIAAAQWVAAKEVELAAIFSTNPTMVSVIREIARIVRALL